jgi:hypothetical protein
MQPSSIPETIIAYAAGFFDGEGCISITKNGAVDVRISNTAKNVLVTLHSYFGGSITNRTQKVNKAQYVYSLYGETAINFLSLIKPFMIDKLPQAEAILEYYRLRNDITTIKVPHVRGTFANPDREILVQVFRDILTEQKQEEH